MSKDPRLPSDALKAKPRPVRTALIVVAAVALIVGGGFGAQAWAQGQADQQAQQKQVDEQSTTFDAVGDTVAGAATDAYSWHEAQVSAQAAKDQQDREAAAAALLAQQQAEAAATAHSSSAGGPIRCPAGSQANSNDGVNDTSCFPTICFGITVPDPAHPECDTAFKP